MTVPKNGRFEDYPCIQKISNEEYHNQAEGISKSGWSKFNDSGLTFIHEKRFPTPAKPTWDVGTVVHAILLEGKTLDEMIVQQPADIKIRRGKKWDAFQEEHEKTGKIILKQADCMKVNGAVAAAKHHHP